MDGGAGRWEEDTVVEMEVSHCERSCAEERGAGCVTAKLSLAASPRHRVRDVIGWMRHVCLNHGDAHSQAAAFGLRS